MSGELTPPRSSAALDRRRQGLRPLLNQFRARMWSLVLAVPTRKGLPVEYKGIRYTVRARIERNEWTVSIHPADIESPRKVVTGPRARAELLARSMIDRWHERAARSKVKPGASQSTSPS